MNKETTVSVTIQMQNHSVTHEIDTLQVDFSGCENSGQVDKRLADIVSQAARGLTTGLLIDNRAINKLVTRKVNQE